MSDELLPLRYLRRSKYKRSSTSNLLTMCPLARIISESMVYQVYVKGNVAASGVVTGRQWPRVISCAARPLCCCPTYALAAARMIILLKHPLARRISRRLLYRTCCTL